MGKGDKKTKRGKIHNGSYGKLRPRKKRMNLKHKMTKSVEKEK
ncbi:MAG: 30S ribosomal protein THX [Flavobacteriaceae bacterium]|nr:30S ribosomal protein THX [Flavobacteriaceae bacterium]|tara:strand:- start:10349 stop:10477 length:129 start_codon:yes stop_codon:yes gene_type:complete